MPPAERDELRAGAERDIEAHAAEMPPVIRDRALRSALARRVRARFSLPDLTLLPLA